MSNLNALKGSAIKKLKTKFSGNTLKKENVDTVVIHWTGGKFLTDAIKTLNKLKLGYHFILENQSGVINIIQGQKLSNRVSHAGESYGPNGKYVNGYSYSISMVGDDNTDYTPFIDTLTKLIIDLRLINPNLKYITGHHQISPIRKIDPYALDFNKLVNSINNVIKRKLIVVNGAPVPLNNLTDSLFTYWKQGDLGKPGLYNDLLIENGTNRRYYISNIGKNKGVTFYYNKSDVVKSPAEINTDIYKHDDTVEE